VVKADSLKQLRTYLGRVFRDVGRKIAGDRGTGSQVRPLAGRG
jgi:hypothetical protein